MEPAPLWEADTVLMPVPLRFATQVAEYVAALKIDRTVTQPELRRSEDSAQTTIVPGQGEWTSTMVAKLADGLPHAGVIALFTRCAESPGTWIIKSDVEERLGISAIQLRNELSALSKLTRRLFEHATWPMQYKKSQGAYYYRMDEPVANWWLESRSASGFNAAGKTA